MQSIRQGLSDIPETISNLVESLPTARSLFPIYRQHVNDEMQCLSDTQSTPSSISGDDNHDRAQAIPNLLITEEWQLVLDHNASVDDLQTAVSRCKELVVNTNECSPERKWLVRHLVELRFRLNEIQEAIDDPQSSGPTAKVILGHHLVPGAIKPATIVRQYCDYCSGIIWSVVQASYVCVDCNYRVHHKCAHRIGRVCAHVIASEIKALSTEISPEIGLAMQQYKCAECSTSLSFNKTWIEARLCDYTGLYYCPACHWNDRIATPARIIHNWDFTPRKVSRASMQLLACMNDRADIPVVDLNPKLFTYVHNMSVVQKLRENLRHMRRYLDECRFAANEKLVENLIGNRRYLIQSPRMFSLADLMGTESGVFLDILNKAVYAFDQHIRHCDICTGKGYLCEICRNNEPMFPYDDGGLQCGECKAMYHRACWIRKNMNCSKCARLSIRRTATSSDKMNTKTNEADHESAQIDSIDGAKS